jgi:hypothetical protein
MFHKTRNMMLRSRQGSFRLFPPRPIPMMPVGGTNAYADGLFHGLNSCPADVLRQAAVVVRGLENVNLGKTRVLRLE